MKLSKDELEQVRGESLESFLQQRQYRLSTSPFGAKPGRVIAYLSRAVAWKKRGKVPRNIQQVQE